MNIKEMKAAIEAILFVSGDAVSLQKLSGALSIDCNTVETIVQSMINEYKKKERGIQIIEIDGLYQLSTKKECITYIRNIYKEKKKSSISQAVLEVLAIVAYKQPITKSQIEAVRGVSCDWALNKLLIRNLIKEVGKADITGKPTLYGTTEEFLRYFGFKNIHDLPKIGEETLTSENIKNIQF